MLVGKICQLLCAYCLVEADDAEVGGVDAHNGGCFFANGSRIVLQMGPVGCAYLAKVHTSSTHDVGNAEGAAYFHELPAGDDSLPALAEGVHDKEHCRSVVVDNKGVLGTGQGAQKMCQKAVSAAAATRLRIELKICVV